MKQKNLYYGIMIMAIMLIAGFTSYAEDMVLDDFEYDDPAEIFERYTNSGTLGTGDAFIYDESIDGSHSMELWLTFEGNPWSSGAVIIAEQEPFSFGPDQIVTLDIKGDPEMLGGDSTVLVFQFRDAAGEVVRFLDYVGPKSSDWITLKMPYNAFQESPWDANPDVAADRGNLVSWEFYVQGVGSEQVDYFETSIFLDNLVIKDTVPPSGGDRVLDNFEYAGNAEIQAEYVGTGTLGLGAAALSTDAAEGSGALRLEMSFTGSSWASAGVRCVNRDPFVFSEDQVVRYSIKGDPVNLANEGAVLVFQLRDANGETIRFLDYAILTTSDWKTMEIPFDAFQESPWDGSPDTPADRGNLVSWEFVIQGVGSEPVDEFEAVVLFDDLALETVAPQTVDTNYVVNRISSSDAPDVLDGVFDSIYIDAAAEISFWEDDTYSPVSEPYDKTRAYMLTDGDKVYCGIVIGDPDTSTLTTDTQNDTLMKWSFDSWEIVFAPNPGQVDGQNYIKFAGDSAGYWDDISPDAEGGTDWSAPSFQTNAYIIDANLWAAEFSVDITDIQDMFTGFDSYGHIGIQVKEPGLNFAFPDRASFGSRNAHWDFSSLDQDVPVVDWSMFE